MKFPIASRFATYCSVLAPPSVCLVFFHILEILSCNSHSQFSKSQLSSLTVYFWLLSRKHMFSTSASEIMIGLTYIPNLSYTKERTYLVNPLSANPTKWSHTLKQFVGYCWRIVWVYLTILWEWRILCVKHALLLMPFKAYYVMLRFWFTKLSEKRSWTSLF